MAENTRLKEVQTEVRTTTEDLRRLAAMVEKMQTTMEARTHTHETMMEEIKVTLQQLLQNSSQPHGSPSNSTSTGNATPLTMAVGCFADLS
jgi:peptidoglycan hydrolase CwlO-like protein